MAKEQIRLGLIGCGGNMRSRVQRRLSVIAEARVAALADPDEKAIKRLMEAAPNVAQARTFSNYRSMLDAVDLDAVMISTPHKFHAEQIWESLDRGLHVLTEKPMVCTVEQAKKVIQKRDAAGKILEVGYQRHFQGPFRLARQRIQSGQLGEVYFMTILQCQKWWNPKASGVWRFSLDMSGGGQLNDSGSHLLDIALWMTGLVPDEAFAYIDTRGAEVDVLTAASVKFANGALCNMSIVGEAAYRGMDEAEYIWGTKGHIAITGTGNPAVTLKTPGEEPGLRPVVRQVPSEEMPMGAPSPDHNFIAAILGREEVEVPAECGLRVIQVSEAIWESARTGRPAKVKV